MWLSQSRDLWIKRHLLREWYERGGAEKGRKGSRHPD